MIRVYTCRYFLIYILIPEVTIQTHYDQGQFSAEPILSLFTMNKEFCKHKNRSMLMVREEVFVWKSIVMDGTPSKHKKKERKL